MYFKHQRDNDRLIKRLCRIVSEARVSHAYIFEGPHCADKRAFVMSFVKGILCPKNLGENCGECGICNKIDHGNHEDVICLSAEKGSIKDNDIVQMQDRIKIKPFGERTIVIIEDADTMTQRAQNRLLKTLEEPPGKTVIILLSENMENLVQTIQSRCVKYRINSFGSDGYDFMMEKAEAIVDMTLRRMPFYQVKDAGEEILKEEANVQAFLDCLQTVYRDMLLQEKQGISLYKDETVAENIHAVEAARKSIKQGVSPAYAIRKLLLEIGG